MQKHDNKLEVLVAAQGIQNESQMPPVLRQLLSSGFPTVLINQTKNDKQLSSTSKSLRIFNYAEKGISRSRKRALEHATGDILLLSDEDVELIDGFSDTIKKAFEKNPQADVITFQCLNEHGVLRKSYPEHPIEHNMRTLMQVSSVEVALRRASFENGSVRFDERFGIGSEIPTGSETVFLSDALKQGLKILYQPEPIVRHPDESSGRTLFRNNSMIRAKGAMFYRIFGWKAYLVSLLFAFKKRKETGFSLVRTARLMYSGIEEFKRLDHGE